MADPAEPSPTALRAVLDVLATANRPMGLLRDGVVVAVNPAFARLFGTDPVAPPGRALLDLVAPASLELVAELARRQSAGEELPASVCITGLTVTRPSCRCSSTPPAWSSTASPTRCCWLRALDEGSVAASSAIQSDDLYRAMFEVNTAVKLLISPRTGRILRRRSRRLRVLRLDAEQLRAMHITDLNTLTRDEVQAEMDQARTRRRGYFRFRHRTACGEQRHVEVHSGPVEIAGETLLLSIVHDVTERDELAEQLAVSHPAGLDGRLAGGVAHDFNNLLTVMLTSTDLLARKLGPTRRCVTTLTTSVHASRQAAELTAGLLAFGGRQMDARRARGAEHADRALDALSRSSLGSAIVVEEAFEPGLPPALADPSQLEQVLVNLAINARDAMEGEGTLSLRASRYDAGEGDSVPAGTGSRWPSPTPARGWTRTRWLGHSSRSSPPSGSPVAWASGWGLAARLRHGDPERRAHPRAQRARQGTEPTLYLPGRPRPRRRAASTVMRPPAAVRDAWRCWPRM